MKSITIAVFHTRGGHVAAAVSMNESSNGDVSYSYTGKYGAGCGPLQNMRDAMVSITQHHKGVKLVISHAIFWDQAIMKLSVQS